MATRSTVKFFDESNELILSVYRQFDGYIDGVGHELANFLKSKTIINGFNTQKMEDGYANGMGCLSAQYVAESKTKIGCFYLTGANDSQDYNYEVRFVNNGFVIKVDDFEGSPDELLNYQED